MPEKTVHDGHGAISVGAENSPRRRNSKCPERKVSVVATSAIQRFPVIALPKRKSVRNKAGATNSCRIFAIFHGSMPKIFAKAPSIQ